MMNLPLNIDFSGKVAVVTGAGGLICGAMAAAFARSGNAGSHTSKQNLERCGILER